MVRARRYRVFLVFAVISTFAFVHFSGIVGWLSSAPEKQRPAAAVHNPIDYESYGDYHTNPHGFAPEPSFAPHPVIPSIFEDPYEDESSAELSPVVEEPEDSAASVQTAVPKPPTNPSVQDNELGQGGKGRLEGDNDVDQSAIRWEKQVEHFPIHSSEIVPLPTGSPKTIPKIQFDFPKETDEKKRAREKNLAMIKDEFLHAWNGYKKNAMGRDEVAPVTGKTRDPFMGWGATLVDSLDALWIMGLKEEFEEAVEETKKLDFGTSKRNDIPVFETVIRYLGGLIGAYDVSGGKYPALLDKALELADILMGAFDTPNRIPATFYYWAPAYASQPHRAGSRVVLAELASLSVEFTRLAQLTKEDKYYDAIARITDELETWQNNTKLPGLWPAHVDASGCKKLPSLEKPDPRDDAPVPQHNGPNKATRKRDTPADDPLLKDAQPADYENKPQPKDTNDQTTDSKVETKLRSESGDVSGSPSGYDCEKAGLQSAALRTKPDRFTLGGLADSAYEYLPKEYMLLGGLNDQYRTMYETAMETTRKHLLFRPMLPDNNRDVRFLASATFAENPVDGKKFEYKYEGSHLLCFAGGMFGIGAKVFGLKGDLDIAKKLTDGCVWAYESTQSGIMPEHFALLPCDNMKDCEWNKTAYYDALDPFEDVRMSRLTAWEEMKASLEGEKEGAKHSEEPQVDMIDEEELVSAEDYTKTKRGDIRNPVPGGLGPRPKVLSHEEYAEKRIKEDRIPPGMVEVSSPKYLLRPEAIESVFIMYRITGDEYWRQKGWGMFESVIASTRTEIAHSAIKDVTSGVPYFTNVMESFWLGETLKYFYLLFSDPQVVSLDEYILNTEAHPHRRPTSV